MQILTLPWIAWAVVSIVVCWIVPGRWRPWCIAAFAFLFLAAADPPSAAILTAMAAVTWWAGTAGRSSKAAVAPVVVLLLGALAAFKSASAFGGGFAMPLGMSYYTFRCVHYAIERFKGALPPHTLAEFAAYLFFLPTLAAGPIHRFPEFHRDLRRTRLSGALVSEGFERVLYGYAKLLVVSGWLIQQQLQPWIAGLAPQQPWLSAYLYMLSAGYMGYMTFAGYSDVAIGAARLTGFRVIENFNNPFASRNIVEFWRRWHISLTSWVRDYLYATVFSLTRKPYLAAIAALLAIGLWHEISARYVIWGLVHGLAVAGCQWYQRRHAAPANPRGRLRAMLGPFAGWFVTFHFVMLSCVFVMHDFDRAMDIYRTLLTGRG
jgi:alginate O-acetyltransferase complex protein AlgI